MHLLVSFSYLLSEMHGRGLFKIGHVSCSADKMTSLSVILQVTGLKSQTKKIINIASWRTEYTEITSGDLRGHTLEYPPPARFTETVYILLYILAWSLLKIN